MPSKREIINEIYSEIRRNCAKDKTILSNLNIGSIKEDDILYYDHDESAVLVIVKDKYFNKGYMCFCDKSAVDKLIQNVEIPFFVYWNCKEKDDDSLNISTLKLYTIYQRDTVTYYENPFTIPDPTNRRDILRVMYEENFGEYAMIEDAEELNSMSLELFDQYSDELPDLEEWRSICENRECLIYREGNNKKNIVAYYVWHLEGKKLYSRMSANKVGANVLYNLERRIFTEYYEQGIRVFYGWSDIYNSSAIGRRTNKAVEKLSRIFCKIYTNTDLEKTKNQKGRKNERKNERKNTEHFR